ncbi:hypothetical protein IQ07DRAFT_183946 [Pyrenochaeta sp. DS3sAY3a]|nr:hypothetical protein IQ07DRAFT_183946 [Pyrenochaeta sp. DS3sAY3a]
MTYAIAYLGLHMHSAIAPHLSAVYIILVLVFRTPFIPVRLASRLHNNEQLPKPHDIGHVGLFLHFIIYQKCIPKLLGQFTRLELKYSLTRTLPGYRGSMRPPTLPNFFFIHAVATAYSPKPPLAVDSSLQTHLTLTRSACPFIDQNLRDAYVDATCHGPSLMLHALETLPIRKLRKSPSPMPCYLEGNRCFAT